MARLRLAVFLVLLAVAAWWGLQHGLGTPSRWRDQWTGRSEAVAVPAFIALYAAATVALLPAGALSLAAGALFGPVIGVGAVWVGAMAGATAAFGLGRLLSGSMTRSFGGPRLARLNTYLDRRGLAAVLLVRLVPLFPFGWVNFAAALTTLTWRSYVVGTALGMLPGVLVYVVLGAGATRPGSPAFWIALAGFAVLTAGGSLLARRHRRATVQE